MTSGARSRNASVGAEAALVRTVERDDDALADVRGQLRRSSSSGMKRYSFGSGTVAGQVHDRVLAELVERELRGQERPEGVAVGVLVRREEEALVRPDRVRDLRSQSPASVVVAELIDQL